MNSVTDVLAKSVVVFSKNYLPISRVNIKRAVVLLIAGKAEPLELSDGSNSDDFDLENAQIK